MLLRAWHSETITSVFSILEMFPNRGTSREYLYHRGVPRWMRWFFLDEDRYAKDLEKRKNTRWGRQLGNRYLDVQVGFSDTWLSAA